MVGPIMGQVLLYMAQIGLSFTAGDLGRSGTVTAGTSDGSGVPAVEKRGPSAMVTGW